MPDLEIDRLLGDALEPTDEFVGSLRAHLADEWRGVLPSQATSSPRPAWRARRWTIAAAAVACLVGGSIYVAARDSRSPTGVVDGTPTSEPDFEFARVATIVFDEPTDAWVSSGGTSALYQRDGQWFVGEYDAVGRISETPVDNVDDTKDHVVDELRVRRDGSWIREGLVIDGDEYRLEDGGWKRWGCYWCRVDMPPPPSAVVDPELMVWTVEYNGDSWTVPVPVGWDGLDPVLSAVSIEDHTSYAVSVVVGTRAGSTLVARAQRDGSVATHLINGTWTSVGSREDGLLARRADPRRLDYSVDLLPWPERSAVPDPAPVDTVPESAVGRRWVVTSVDGVSWTQSTMSWFTVDASGATSGFDACNWYNWDPVATAGTMTAMACDNLQAQAHGPFSFDDPGHLRSGLLLAEAFEALPPPTEEQLIGWWSFDGIADAVQFAPDHTVQLGSCIAIGTWTLSEGALSITVADTSTAYNCLDTSVGSRVVEQLVDGGGDMSLRANGALLVNTQQFTSQLTRPAELGG
jgi:hypothetical protein